MRLLLTQHTKSGNMSMKPHPKVVHGRIHQFSAQLFPGMRPAQVIQRFLWVDLAIISGQKAGMANADEGINGVW